MTLDDLDDYEMTDQPEECPQCGTRTEFMQIDTERQVHVCLSKVCREIFVVSESSE